MQILWRDNEIFRRIKPTACYHIRRPWEGKVQLLKNHSFSRITRFDPPQCVSSVCMEWGQTTMCLRCRPVTTHTVNHTNEMPLTKTWTATVRYELGDTHTYEFVEGTETAPIADGK
jgi:hypothetical protein